MKVFETIRNHAGDIALATLILGSAGTVGGFAVGEAVDAAFDSDNPATEVNEDAEQNLGTITAEIGAVFGASAGMLIMKRISGLGDTIAPDASFEGQDVQEPVPVQS